MGAPTKQLRGRLRGRGGFFGGLKKVWNRVKAPLKTVASAAGTAALGSLKRQFLGSGAYTSAFVTDGKTFRTKSGAAIRPVGEFGVQITMRESIATIYSSTAWKSRVYRINPGLDDSFPWLSKVANNFQQYRYDQLIYTFESSTPQSVGMFTSVGVVLGVAIMNPDQAQPTNQMMMEQTQFCSATKPTDSVDIPVECDPREGGSGIKPIRVGEVAGGYHDYDAGYLQIATINQPADDVALGRLYVTYTVTLFNPIYRGAGSGANYAHYRSTTASTVVLGTTQTKVVDQIGLTIASAAANIGTIDFPAGSSGTYLIQIWWASATAASPCATIVPTLTNMAFVPTLFGGGAGYMQAPQPSGAGAQESVTIMVSVLDTSKPSRVSVQVTAGALPWTSGQVETIVSQVDPVAA